MSIPEITDVERLTLRPGDALVVRFQHRLYPEQAAAIERYVRAALELDESTPVLVLDDGASVDVIEAAPEITR